MCSLWSLIVFVLLISCSVEGSSYCMADCNSNGQRPYTKYEALCCSPSNKGNILHITRDNGRPGIIVCPNTIPTWCSQISCYNILLLNPTAPSGYYNVTVSNGSQVEVYCDMEGTECDGEGGWARVALIDMSVPGSTCPPGLTQYNEIFNTGLCYINSGLDNDRHCNSTFFSTNGLTYTKVCGQVRGYQYRGADAFNCHINNIDCFNSEIKSWGVTFTYDSNPRKHIWTYAAGHYEQALSDYELLCPCNTGSPFMNYTIPFVGSDYYCETARLGGQYGPVLYSGDPLWDGHDCPGDEATCCTSSKMPWFVKTLNEVVSDGIELTICGSSNDDIINIGSGTPLNLIELYIK